MSLDARIIYQGVLDQTTDALFAPDLKAWVSRISIPHHMSTSEGKLVHETRKDVETGFADFVGALARMQVQKMTRTCEFARYVDKNCITGFHTAEMFRADGTKLPTYNVKWVLYLSTDADWRVAKSESALISGMEMDVPHCALSQFEREDNPDNQKLRHVVQTIFDKTDAAFLHGTFEDWVAAFELPMVVETKSSQKVLTTPEELRADLKLYQDAFRIHRVTDVTRVVQSADIIDDDMMTATYRAHVLNGANYVVPAWDGAATLRKRNGTWRFTKLMGALSHLDWNDAHQPTRIHAQPQRSDTPELETAEIMPLSRRDTND